MENEHLEEKRYLRAKKRVKEIQGFYWHLFWYLAINIFITFGGVIRNMFSGDSFYIVDLGYGSFSVWFFWGIGLFFHWIGVFGKNMIFSKDWEKRKIKEFMDKDKSGF